MRAGGQPEWTFTINEIHGRLGTQAGGRRDPHEGITLAGYLKRTSAIIEIRDSLGMQAGRHRDSREGKDHPRDEWIFVLTMTYVVPPLISLEGIY
jgi:hypothetical protein